VIRGCAGLALALALLILATPAQAAKKSIWGPSKLPDGSSAFTLYEELGVDVYQIQLSWPDVAPVRPDPSTAASDPANPAYVWPTRLDETIADAASHGIEVAIMLKGRGTPAWANGDRDPSWVPDSDADFADYAAAASRRYPRVRYWMVWGETTQQNNFNPMSADSADGPRRYALLLDAAYAALKGVKQSNLVIGGMTHSAGVIRPRKYIDWLRLPDGRPPRLDLYGHNPLSYRFPLRSQGPQLVDMRDMSDLDTLQEDLRRAYGTGRVPPLWLSEYTISSDQRNRAFAIAVTRAEQARWLTAAYRIADQTSGVHLLGWFNMFDDPVTRPEHLTTGLMTYEGEIKPAFGAFRAAPSARSAPRVTVAGRISRRSLTGRGLAVRLQPRTGGRHTVRLRRGSRIVVSRSSEKASALTLRLRPRRAKPGRYTVEVKSPRGETLRFALAVR